MRRLCDLHAHSTASDGLLSPSDLVRLADRQRLAGVALTDHDTIDGLAEAAAAAKEFPELTFVPGVELSAVSPQGTLHVLGLGIDPAAAPLRTLITQLIQARDERNPRIIAKLQALGVKIDMDDVRQAAQGPLPRDGAARSPVLGRMHMAEVLLDKGYARSIEDAFARYLGDNAPAYVDKERLSPRAVADAIHGAGGLAMIAHPVHLLFENFSQAQRLIRMLVEQGVDGLEAYHSEHSALQTRFFLDLASRLNLAVSGGSDFHGQVKPHVQLGRPRVPVQVVRDLMGRLGQNDKG
jgi:3',5'-nucleoside bisphosphate phosphatase